MSLRAAGAQDIVIIGASGDLSRRKLLPALYNLAARGLLPERGDIVGLARNSRLNALAAPSRERAEARFASSGDKQRLFAEFSYAAGLARSKNIQLL